MFSFFLGATFFFTSWLLAWLKIDFALDRLSREDYARLLNESKLRDVRFGFIYVLTMLGALALLTYFPTIPVGLKLGFAGSFLIFIVGKLYGALERIKRLSLGNDLRRAVLVGFSVMIASYCFLLFMISDAVMAIRIWR